MTPRKWSAHRTPSHRAWADAHRPLAVMDVPEIWAGRWAKLEEAVAELREAVKEMEDAR